ncbi:MAG: hypothetical protein DRP51_10085 [Candidatus Zixiibacteriota bacterium]|nr:MAG: hypothetical protein DRP51_10085 [candidate division Zixibacteria bacterium]
MKTFKNLLSEASGTYQGLLLTPKSINAAIILGIEIGSKKMKNGNTGPNNVFLKDEDVKKLSRFVLGTMNKEAGTYDFSTEEFFKSGIRGVLKGGRKSSAPQLSQLDRSAAKKLRITNKK